MTISHKICKKCNLEKNVLEFSKLTQSEDGYLFICKNCDSLRRGRKIKPIKQINLTVEQLAYLAALIDGEGYIGLCPGKNHHLAMSRLVIYSTSNNINDIQKEFQIGKIYLIESKNQKHKNLFMWFISHKETKLLLPQITNYLKFKKLQAQLLWEYFNLKRDRSEEYRNKAKKLSKEITSLNKRGCLESEKENFQTISYMNNDIKLTEIAKLYLAGLIDGEGHLSLERKRRSNGRYKGNLCFESFIKIGVTNKCFCDIVKEYNFGLLYSIKTQKKNHKNTYMWQWRSNEIRQILPQLIPHLKIRKKQAELVLEFLTLSKNKNSLLYKSKVNIIHDALRKLNKRGPDVK